MSQPKVLVTFYSYCGATEALALAAAVGAVEARASIRLRRWPDLIPTDRDSEPECRETLRRLEREYVAPTENDLVWADAVVFGMPARLDASSGEWVEWLTWLARLRDRGLLEGKVGGVLVSASSSAGMDTESDTRSKLSASLVGLGFAPLPPDWQESGGAGLDEVTSAKIRGRRAAEFRALEATSVSGQGVEGIVGGEQK